MFKSVILASVVVLGGSLFAASNASAGHPSYCAPRHGGYQSHRPVVVSPYSASRYGYGYGSPYIGPDRYGAGFGYGNPGYRSYRPSIGVGIGGIGGYPYGYGSGEYPYGYGSGSGFGGFNSYRGGSGFGGLNSYRGGSGFSLYIGR